jgi:Flp pilus assembly protein TadD
VPGAPLRWRRRAALTALLAAGLLGVLAPVGCLTGRHTGKWSVLPLSGGLNLWLGNAPDLCQTLTLRPGERWQELVEEPARLKGERRPGEQERYFLSKTAEAARQEPGVLLGNLGRKTLRLFASRELPRNLDLYAARPYSSLLSALVWKLGPFGFPFGLLLPLGGLGLWTERRRIPPPVWLALAGLCLALVLVFPTARHRLPMVPLLAPLAALGGMALWRAFGTVSWRGLLPGGALALGLLGLGTLPGVFCEERGPFAGELHLGAGAYHAKHGRLVEARRQYEEALQRAPSLHEARVNLGVLLHRQGDRQGALAQYDEALSRRPRSAQALLGRALVLLDLDRPGAALEDLRALVRVEPWAPGHRFLLGQVLARLGLFREAQAAFRAADRRAPDDPQTLNALAWLASGRDDPSLRRPGEAIGLAKRACALTGRKDPSLIDTLAVAHEAAGDLDRARALYAEAAHLARSQGKTALALQIEERLRAAGGAGAPPPPPPAMEP